MVFFTDVFKVDESLLDAYGAFNISLINDLPLFVDPFLLFGSEKTEYKALHKDILKYLGYLKDTSYRRTLTVGELEALYVFPEIKQNWFGYSKAGNFGNGLGMVFAQDFSKNLQIIFDDLGHETIVETSHLEKATLFDTGVGRDNISDFTTTLIKEYLLEYTQDFAVQYLDKKYLKTIPVEKVYFDYDLGRWMPKKYTLPYFLDDFVLLTPKDILTKDNIWINRHDLEGEFGDICISIPNTQLRYEIGQYFASHMPPPSRTKRKTRVTQKERSEAISKVLQKFPLIIDYFIKSKEEDKAQAVGLSEENVSEIKELFNKNVTELIQLLRGETDFYEQKDINSYDASFERLLFLKKVIEDNDGYRLFYNKGLPIKREADLQIVYRLTWFAAVFDVNREVNNGRGPVDYKISKGSKDKTLVEFKLASNSKLKSNLEKQVAVYEKANDTKKSIKVIMFFDDYELAKVNNILEELNLVDADNIILIDARSTNKVSASNA